MAAPNGAYSPHRQRRAQLAPPQQLPLAHEENAAYHDYWLNDMG